MESSARRAGINIEAEPAFRKISTMRSVTCVRGWLRLCDSEQPTRGFSCPELRRGKRLKLIATRDIFTMTNGDNEFHLCMAVFTITKGFSYLV